MLLYSSHFSIRSPVALAQPMKFTGERLQGKDLSKSMLNSSLERRPPLFLCLFLLPLPAGRGDVMTVMEETSFDCVT